MFSLMWSEHCSYKHSPPLLRGFPPPAPRVLQGPGENAGVVDVGDGIAVVLKIESHNHPSAVEPFQGAATGVGGILRDIFTMGARPIALLDRCASASSTEPAQPLPLHGVVAGIGHYGNCIGVPTVGGEVVFDDGYAGNPPGQRHVRRRRCARRHAARGGARRRATRCVLVGAAPAATASTARAFASAELDERRGASARRSRWATRSWRSCCSKPASSSGRRRRAGDPGPRRGRAHSAASEMAAGPAAASTSTSTWCPCARGLTPVEIMLSESQERMLAVVAPRGRGGARRLPALGPRRRRPSATVTEDGLLRVRDGARSWPSCRSRLLDRRGAGLRACPAPPPPRRRSTSPRAPEPADLAARAAARCSAARTSPAGAAIFEQYDHLVRRQHGPPPGRRRRRASACADSRQGLALTTDCAARYCRARPAPGAARPCAEAARNLACVGAAPIAVDRLPQLRQPREGPTPGGWPRRSTAWPRPARPSTCRSSVGNV